MEHTGRPLSRVGGSSKAAASSRQARLRRRWAGYRRHPVTACWSLPPLPGKGALLAELLVRMAVADGWQRRSPPAGEGARRATRCWTADQGGISTYLKRRSADASPFTEMTIRDCSGWCALARRACRLAGRMVRVYPTRQAEAACVHARPQTPPPRPGPPRGAQRHYCQLAQAPSAPMRGSGRLAAGG